MLVTPHARFLRKRFKKNRVIIGIGNDDSKTYSGSNRRATSILPFPQLGNENTYTYNIHSDYQRLLLSLEANQISCCLHVTSEKCKSRAAILVYRGRALGCIYGSKTLGRYLFDKLAYERGFADLVGAKHCVEAYPLTDELVLAAASLFHGTVIETGDSTEARQSFAHAFDSLIGSNLPGCIVLNGVKDRSLCFVYVHQGSIAGIYSDRHGWLKAKQDTIVDYFKRHKELSIEACVLPINELPDMAELSFSLLGIDKHATGDSLLTKFVIPNIFFLSTMDTVKKMKFATGADFSRFFPRKAMRHPAINASKYGKYNEAYAVHP